MDGSQINFGDKCNISVDRKVTQNAKQFVGVINGGNSTDISTCKNYRDQVDLQILFKDNDVSNESGYNHRNICSKDSFELGDTKQIQLKDTVCEISSDKMTCSPSCNSRGISCDQMIDNLGDESYKESGTEQGYHGARKNVTLEKGVQPDTNRQVSCINNDSELMASKQNEEHRLTVTHSNDRTHCLENINGNINYKTNTECEEKNAEKQHTGGNCNIKSNLLENSDHRCFPFFD